MVWVLDSPLTEKEKKAFDVLKERLGDDELARNTVKFISLFAIIRGTRFESPKEIERGFYFDKAKKHPLFNKSSSEELYKQLYDQKGGAASNYPFIDYSAKQGLDKIGKALPPYISTPVQNFYDLISTPLLTVKQSIPIVDLAISAGNGMAETGITALGDFAKTIGGPWGLLISIPLVAFAASLASMWSILQKDFGQTVIYMTTAIPIAGPLMVKGFDKIEKQVSKFKKYPEIAYYIPVISDYINEERKKKGLPPLQPFSVSNAVQSNPYAQKAMTLANSVKGGKRFSTQKSKYKQWMKTRRNKSARV